MTVQGQSIAIATGPSALSSIDTGATLIGGPPADVRAIYAAIPGAQSPGKGGFWEFRMFLFPNFKFSRMLMSCSLQYNRVDHAFVWRQSMVDQPAGHEPRAGHKWVVDLRRGDL